MGCPAHLDRKRLLRSYNRKLLQEPGGFGSFQPNLSASSSNRRRSCPSKTCPRKTVSFFNESWRSIRRGATRRNAQMVDVKPRRSDDNCGLGRAIFRINVSTLVLPVLIILPSNPGSASSITARHKCSSLSACVHARACALSRKNVN